MMKRTGGWRCERTTTRMAALLATALLAATLPGTAMADDAAAEPAQDDASTDERDPALSVHEVVVLIYDAHGTHLNAETLFESTLPTFVMRRRETARGEARHAPSPVGLMTLDGPPKMGVDVLLEAPGGRFLSTWPAAETRTGRALWRDLTLDTDPQRLSNLPQSHWLAPLRTRDDRSFLTLGRQSEKFLLYDLTLPYSSPVALEALENGLGVTNESDAPLHDVTLVTPDESKGPGQWRRATLGTLSPGSASEGAASEDTLSDAMQATPAEPGETPHTEPAPERAAEAIVHSDAYASVDTANLWQPLAATLAELGFNEAEVGVATRILDHHCQQATRLTVVYRLDPALLEDLLPLEVTPVPQQRIRAGLVVLLNADPQVSEHMDQLIEQLGAPAWADRETAHQALLEFGGAARPRLEKARNHQDIEVVYRVEQLLEAIDMAAGPRSTDAE